MKRTYIILIAASLVLLCSCGNNQNKKKSGTKTADTESVEEQYIKEDIKIKLDSLVSELGRINATPIVENIDNGKVNLSAAVKKNRPDYLMPLDKVSEAVTLSEKYRALIVYYVDMRFAKLFDMPLDAYKQTLAKLIMDINDPAIPTDVEKSASLLNNMGPNVQQYYNESVKSNTVAYFWETMAAGSLEHLYIITRNIDLFMPLFNDQTASEVSYRLILVHEGIKSLIPYEPELEEIQTILKPLEVLNATNANELRSQLTELKGAVETARAQLF